MEGFAYRRVVLINTEGGKTKTVITASLIGAITLLKCFGAQDTETSTTAKTEVRDVFVHWFSKQI